MEPAVDSPGQTLTFPPPSRPPAGCNRKMQIFLEQPFVVPPPPLAEEVVRYPPPRFFLTRSENNFIASVAKAFARLSGSSYVPPNPSPTGSFHLL